MSHTHQNAHDHCEWYGGGHYEVCACGATRAVLASGKPRIQAGDDANGWHTCKLCTPQFYKGAK